MKNLLEQIQSRLDELNRAECRVTEVILRNPRQAIRFSIATLAQVVAVSEPTANRFCRSLGMSGYPELKIQLAQSLASGAALVIQAVAEDDGSGTCTRKTLSSTTASPDSAHKLFDPCVIGRAVNLLIQTRQIHFFGLGASVSAALDAQHKLLHFNLVVSAQADVLMQRMIASAVHTGDLLVVISYTGRTCEPVEVVHPARENGAPVLGLTTVGSSLAKASTLCLDIPLPEDTDTYMPMTSRIVQFIVLDVLAIGVTLCRGVDFQLHLRRIKEGLVPTRYPLDEDN